MKTAVFNEFGKVEDVIKFVDREIPTARDDGIVVKVQYAAINRVDATVIEGFLKDSWGCSLPFYPGYDFSGTVHAVGKDVNEFKEGDAVWACNWASKRGQHDDEGVDGKPAPTVASALAEYIELPASKVSRKPDGIGHDVAAAVALVGTTAYQGVERILTDKSVGPDTKVLILGGAGAVGQMAVQLAKAKGAWVATTCSPRTRSFVETLGADLIIDYRAQKWEEVDALKGIDGVLDTVGDGNSWERATSSGVLDETGNYAAISGKMEAGFDPKGHPPRPHAAWFCLLNSVKHQDDLLKLVGEGKLKVVIADTFPFTQEGVIEALQKQNAAKSIGKNIIKIGA